MCVDSNQVKIIIFNGTLNEHKGLFPIKPLKKKKNEKKRQKRKNKKKERKKEENQETCVCMFLCVHVCVYVCTHTFIYITELPDKTFWDCPCLATLNLSHNCLDLVPSNMSSCKALTHLDLSHNKLCSLCSAWNCKLVGCTVILFVLK